MAAPVIVMIGAPGAGKGTQSDILAKRLGGVHLSSGQILRDSADPQLAATMARGELVDLDSLKRVVGPRLAQVPTNVPMVLDGFIRLPEDEAWLARQLGKVGRVINKVVYLEIDEAEADKRNIARHRGDDNGAVLKRRWADFRHQTMPVIESLRNAGLLVTIDGHGTFDEVAARIHEALGD